MKSSHPSVCSPSEEKQLTPLSICGRCSDSAKINHVPLCISGLFRACSVDFDHLGDLLRNKKTFIYTHSNYPLLNYLCYSLPIRIHTLHSYKSSQITSTESVGLLLILHMASCSQAYSSTTVLGTKGELGQF